MSEGGEKKGPGIIQLCATWGMLVGLALAILATILGDASLVPAALAGVFVGGLLGAIVGGVARLFMTR